MYAEKIARLGEKLNDNNAQRLVDAVNYPHLRLSA